MLVQGKTTLFHKVRKYVHVMFNAHEFQLNPVQIHFTCNLI